MDAPPARPGSPVLGVLSELGEAERAALLAELETRTLKRGDVLVRQGEQADALFIVVSGRFAVTVDGRREPVAEIGPDQPIGEIAFLSGGSRTATVSALRDSLVLRLDRDDFERVAERCPGIWRGLTAALSQRVAATTVPDTAMPAPRPRTLAIIRAGASQIPPRFLAELVSAFSPAGSTRVLDAERCAAALPAGTEIDSPEATQALNRLESEADFVIFLADPELTPWSQKAIRHADLVLAVGVDGADPAPNALEVLAASLVRPEARRLAIVRARREPITGTSRWLRHRTVAMHHHVALDDRESIERLYRFISGNALGLVACGGGALCAAHVGVYKALLESGLTFDALGGTSAGAAMTAAFAMGKQPDDIDRATHDIFVTNRAMQRYTWPRYSLLDHRHYDAQLRRYFAGVNIEDLWIPFFAVSTNLSSYALHRHDRGDLFDAVRASASIPVLLPPVYTADGDMLVDGCLLDNVPVRTMQQLKSGPNIVVSFHLPQLERFDVAYDTLPSRAELIRMSLNPLARGRLPDAPGLTTVLMRSLMANRHDFNRQLTPEDVLLVPPVPDDMGILDWHRHTELVRSAYWWGLEEMRRLQRARHPLIAKLEAAQARDARPRTP